MKTKKHVIAIQLMGGFGNQLFQLSKALSLVEKSETIFVYQRDSNSDIDLIINNVIKHGIDIVRVDRQEFYFAKVADRCVGMLLAIELGNRKVWFPRVIRGILKLIAFCLFRLQIPVKGISIAKGLGHIEDDKRSKEKLLIGYFQTFHPTSSNFVSKHIKCAIEETRRNEARSDFLQETKGTLILHVRLGDYIQEEKFGILGIDYYINAIQLYKTENIGRFLIFSDDIQLAKKLYGDSLQEQAYRVFGSETYASWIQSVNDSTLDTFHLMRTGSHFIIANSSFSWWAARMSEVRDAKVIAPDPWFHRMESPLDLYPPEWVTLSPSFKD